MKLSIRLQPTNRFAFSPWTWSVIFFHWESDRSTSSKETTFWEPSTQYTRSRVLARPLDTISNCRWPSGPSKPIRVPREVRSWRMLATNTKPSLFWIWRSICFNMGGLTGGRWSKRMKRYAGASEFWPLNCLAPSVLRVMWVISNKSNEVSSSCSPSKNQTRGRANRQLLQGRRRRAHQLYCSYNEIDIFKTKNKGKCQTIINI